jgi:hypothetical protein
MQDRKHYQYGGSDAVKLYTYEQWTDVWLEKTKAAEPVDLSDNFKVQLGTYTEAFNREWFCKKRKAKGKEYILEHPVLPPFDDWVCDATLSANLDGYLPEENAVVEFKHTFEGNNLVELERSTIHSYSITCIVWVVVVNMPTLLQSLVTHDRLLRK